MSSSRRRWALVAGVVALLAAGGAVLAILLRSPGNVSHPNVSFVSSTPTVTAPPPKKVVVDHFAWPRYGYDAGRTRFFAGGLKPPFRIGWRYQDYALLEFPPVIYGGSLYLIDDDASAKAINKHTGHTIWARKVGSLAAASPGLAIPQGLVIVPLLSVNPNAGQVPGNGRILALSMKDGHTVWSHVVPAGTESSPMVYGNRVFFGDQSGAVQALDATTGRVLWTYHAQGSVKGGPSWSGGKIYFGDYAGRAYCLDAATGREVWAVGTNGTHFGFGSGNFYSTPAVAFGRVYMGNTDGRVYSFSASTGTLAWATGTGAYVYASPAVADLPGIGPTVYLGSYDGNFYAFDAQSGSIRWSHPSGGKISGSPTIIGGVVYYSDLGSRTTIGLDARSGRQVFSYRDGAFNPMIADPGAIYMSGYSMLYQLLPRGAR